MQHQSKSSVTIRRVRLSIGFAVLFSLAGLCNAQVDRSGLTGTVTDPSGSLLPQAHVTVVDNATGLRREAVSNARGIYSIPELPVRIYTVTIEHQGFSESRVCRCAAGDWKDAHPGRDDAGCRR